MNVNVDGTAIAIHEHGSGSAVMLVHGNSLCAESYGALWAEGGRAAFRFIAPDLPGHGASEPLSDATEMSVPGYATLVTQLLAVLDLEQVVMVGHSLGGHVVMEMMSAPQVAGAFIFGAPPIGAPADVPRAFSPHPAMALAFKPELSPEEADELASAFAGSQAELAGRWIRQTSVDTRTALAQSMQQGRFADEVSLVRTYDRPLAVAHGEIDPLVSRGYLESLEIPTLWRRAVQIMPNAGHCPQLEQPKAFAKLLLEFVTDVMR